LNPISNATLAEFNVQKFVSGFQVIVNMFQGKGENPRPGESGAGQVCYLYLSLIKGRDSSMAFRVRPRSFLGVSVADIVVVEGREEKALADEFGVEIRAFGL
jgi:hypothetical protein